MTKDIIEFIRSYRQPISVWEAAGDLATLGLNGADWPRATAEHWKREIEKLVADGSLVEDAGGCVSVRRVEKVGQLELF